MHSNEDMEHKSLIANEIDFYMKTVGLDYRHNYKENKTNHVNKYLFIHTFLKHCINSCVTTF